MHEYDELYDRRLHLLDDHVLSVLLSLGPNLTMQRSKIEEKYAETIEALYGDASTDEAAK